MPSLSSLLAGAEAVVAEAAAKLVAMQGSPLRIERKDLLDIVTEADLASEAIVVGGLRTLTPDAGFLAEESGASQGGQWRTLDHRSARRHDQLRARAAVVLRDGRL